MDWIDPKPKWAKTRQGKMAAEALDLVDADRSCDALTLIDDAIESFPKESFLLVIKGRILSELNESEAAEGVVRQAIGMRSDHNLAWNELGRIYGERSEFPKAAFCYEKSAQLVPEVNVLTVLANMQLTFAPELAKATAERALEIDPSWVEAQRVKRTAIRYIREEERQ